MICCHDKYGKSKNVKKCHRITFCVALFDEIKSTTEVIIALNFSMTMSDCDELWSAHPYERKSERVIERERERCLEKKIESRKVEDEA